MASNSIRKHFQQATVFQEAENRNGIRQEITRISITYADHRFRLNRHGALMIWLECLVGQARLVLLVVQARQARQAHELRRNREEVQWIVIRRKIVRTRQHHYQTIHFHLRTQEVAVLPETPVTFLHHIPCLWTICVRAVTVMTPSAPNLIDFLTIRIKKSRILSNRQIKN